MRPQPIQTTPRSVLIWLVFLYLLILAMVMIGGITRLTGSGLSMVEWHPLMGTLPPMSEASWLEVFAQYQLSPQYLLVNDWMTLEDFKRIFFWEYFHRLVARSIGAAFAIPWFVFLIRRRMSRRMRWRTGLAFVLGGLQGLLGWFMVKSGLVDVPAVSHYRLAAHLILAFIVACWILWIIFDELPASAEEPAPIRQPGLARAAWGLVGLVLVQSVWGAFMAGTRVGSIYTTFPDMHGAFVPPTFLTMSPLWRDPLENQASIHFIHRTLGWLVLISVLVYWVFAWRKARGTRQVRSSFLLLGVVTLQFVLGMLTVMFRVPVSVATIHQGTSLLLLSAALFAAHSFGRGSPFGSRDKRLPKA